MKKKLLLGVFVLLAVNSVGAANNSTADFNESFELSPDSVDTSVSVNRFGVNLENMTGKYIDNETGSRSFDVKVKGNVSRIVDSPDSFTLFNNESGGFPLVGNVPANQPFGTYTGELVMEANENLSDSTNLTVKVVDDIKPSFTDVTVGDVQATEEKSWSVEVEDNINVSRVNFSVARTETVREGNASVTENQSVVSGQLSQGATSGDGQYTYTFTSTDTIGKYWIKFTVADTSGNTEKRIVGFNVTGLDSISVTDSNFVFDTIRPKEDTEKTFVENRLKGKEFTVTLQSLSYGGNESVKIGVLPPGEEGAIFLDVNDSESFDSQGNYELVVKHQGSNEVKGIHSFDGRLSVSKPVFHVKPVNESVSFSGNVKNLDKPPEDCLAVAEFEACIGYSYDSVKSLFEDRYGEIGEVNESFAYKISRVPISQVEGSDEWRDSTGFTMGEYNETLTEAIREKEEAIRKKNGMKTQRDLAVASLLFFMFITIGNSYGRGTIEAQKKIRKSNIGQVVENPDDIELGRI